MLRAALFVVVPKWTYAPKCSSTNEGTHYIHAMEYYSAIKKNNKILIHATT